MAKSKTARSFEFEVISVRLDEILEHDHDTSNFLTKQDYQTDTSVALESWNPQVNQIAALCTLLILVKRHRGYAYLGTGHTLRWLQQILQPHDEVHALLLKSSRVSKETKLNVLATELLFLPAFFRTRRFLPWKNMSLWQAIVAAGGNPIHGHGTLAFCRATGHSHNSVKPPRRESHVASSTRSEGLQISAAGTKEDME